ncbi:lytic transglycosylase domain-containing protein [Glycomyces sp. TRM65418]|uniref:lytic transglycosylase domain-containing protein n=1 Tax=Glycomyces sp. TRM65418 TaxID=2867006 RepID=UPI001CE679A3|nr:lytic transglycosylase domain-containing protein [Glycomyces sp. TRM65418]MCC3763816.1 lytic transglycosylase domain-containing protein [Glycomyces sp. TRM65418]QZD53524.1 lytic transglycosylase domain-containing protein [Glycomyces sp. TRM65418]
MIPLLTRYGAKLAAVLVLALGAVIAVNAVTDDPAELDAQHPSRAAAEQQAEAEKAYEEVRYRHVNYIAETAGADVTVKAEAVADYALTKAEGLDSAQEEADQAAEEAAQQQEEEESAGSSNPTSVDIPGSCSEYSGNKATGCALAQERGFDLEQVGCLVALWDRESGWNEYAANGIGAYGIPQALPGSKMSSEGDDWETNPVTQIKWGLGYIAGRYGTPCEAWNHSEEVGWY